MKSLFNSQRVRLALGATLSALIITLSLWVPRLQQPGDPFLQRQAQALRPAFRDDLQAIREAPRYTLQATIQPEQGLVIGSLIFDYTNTTGGRIDELPFRLFPNAGSIYGGGSLEVSAVRRGEVELQTRREMEDTLLWVVLDTPLEPGASLTLEMDFQDQVPKRSRTGYGIFNWSRGVIALAGWYPLLPAYYQGAWQLQPVPQVGDALFANTSFYEVEIEAPASYRLASTGQVLEETSSEGEMTTWRIASGPAREFTLALSEAYQEPLETEVEGVTLRVSLLAQNNASTSPQETLDILATAYRTFTEHYGPYPYTEFDLAEVPISIGGYEFSGLVFSDDGYRANRSLGDYEYILAHELSHQWFYGLVGNPTVEQPWLDEAFATYSGVLYQEAVHSRATGQAWIRNWVERDGERQNWQPPLDASALAFDGWAGYRRTVYTHGAIFLDRLRERMGDDVFFRFLHNYQDTYRYGIANTEDFQQMAEQAAGQPLDDLFSSWFGK